jgi:hypothetical protein
MLTPKVIETARLSPQSSPGPRAARRPAAVTRAAARRRRPAR